MSRQQAIGNRQQAAGHRPALPQVRCVCGHRLFDGELIGEIKCDSCKRIVKFVAKEKKSAYLTD